MEIKVPRQRRENNASSVKDWPPSLECSLKWVRAPQMKGDMKLHMKEKINTYSKHGTWPEEGDCRYLYDRKGVWVLNIRASESNESNSGRVSRIGKHR